MTKLITFRYTILGYTGTCVAVSVAQAIDRAKVDYLKTNLKIDPSSYRFRMEKSKISDVRLSLDPYYDAKFKKLYRTFQYGDCSQSEVDDLNQLRTITEDLSSKG
jgi:hypothetical protein